MILSGIYNYANTLFTTVIGLLIAVDLIYLHERESTITSQLQKEASMSYYVSSLHAETIKSLINETTTLRAALNNLSLASSTNEEIEENNTEYMMNMYNLVKEALDNYVTETDIDLATNKNVSDFLSARISDQNGIIREQEVSSATLTANLEEYNSTNIQLLSAVHSIYMNLSAITRDIALLSESVNVSRHGVNKLENRLHSVTMNLSSQARDIQSLSTNATESRREVNKLTGQVYNMTRPLGVIAMLKKDIKTSNVRINELAKKGNMTNIRLSHLYNTQSNISSALRNLTNTVRVDYDTQMLTNQNLKLTTSLLNTSIYELGLPEALQTYRELLYLLSVIKRIGYDKTLEAIGVKELIVSTSRELQWAGILLLAGGLRDEQAIQCFNHMLQLGEVTEKCITHFKNRQPI